ncbi:hypothetical protein [Wenzhouxiangella sp. EGI_FJ10305]|uniref:hypothetical protein n=1 Tax=Wenzhouxiangella sp. EGI_FJ10305 TaxID=3243768 RepID=UPI0035E2054C
MRKAVLAVALLAWLPISGGAASTSVKSDIHRCIGEDDLKIFTDRACSALGARDRAEEPVRPAVLNLPLPHYDCSRKIDIFHDQVSAALDSGDVNKLSGLYHWMEDTPNSADILMDELQVISSRRLAGIEVESIELDGEEHPTRLWLDQYVPERPGHTIRTNFNLVMNGGCWWLHR